MDYKEIYTEKYFKGKGSFFYLFGYGRFQKFYFKNLFKPLKPYLKEIKRGRVLDIGCAYGFMLQKFPESFEKFGIDISDYAISKAKQRIPGAALIAQEAEKDLPFEKDFFDIVICNDVIEHLENPTLLLNNIRRVLKTNGIFYINTPNANWLREKIFSRADEKEHHISLFSHKNVLDLLKGLGFNVIDHWTYINIAFPSFIKFRSNIGTESAFICTKS